MESGAIPNASLTSSSYHPHGDWDRLPIYARFGRRRFWANSWSDSQPWIQVDLRGNYTVTGLLTKGNRQNYPWHYWVEQIKVQVGMISEANLVFVEDEHGQPIVGDVYQIHSFTQVYIMASSPT